MLSPRNNYHELNPTNIKEKVFVILAYFHFFLILVFLISDLCFAQARCSWKTLLWSFFIYLFIYKDPCFLVPMIKLSKFDTWKIGLNIVY